MRFQNCGWPVPFGDQRDEAVGVGRLREIRVCAIEVGVQRESVEREHERCRHRAFVAGRDVQDVRALDTAGLRSVPFESPLACARAGAQPGVAVGVAGNAAEVDRDVGFEGSLDEAPRHPTSAAASRTGTATQRNIGAWYHGDRRSGRYRSWVRESGSGCLRVWPFEAAGRPHHAAPLRRTEHRRSAEEGYAMFKHLLVTLDGSPRAEVRCCRTRRTSPAQPARSSRWCGSSNPRPPNGAKTGAIGKASADATIRSLFLEQAGTYLERIGTQLKETGAPVSMIVREGNPAKQIIAIAKDAGVDAIAMATHSRRGSAG